MKSNRMSSVVIVGSIILLLAGCMSMPQPLDPVCAREGADKSFICKVAAEHGFAPEDLHGIILDTATVAIVSDQVEREEVVSFAKNMREVVGSTIMSYTTLIMLVFDESEDSPLIAAMVQRRLGLFYSPLIISNFDRGLIMDSLGDLIVMLGS